MSMYIQPSRLIPSVRKASTHIHVTSLFAHHVCSARYPSLFRTFTTSSARARSLRSRQLWENHKITVVDPEIRRLHIDEFTALVEREIAGASHALGCLAKHKEDIERLPMLKRREECKQVRAGSTIFAWLLGKREDEIGPIFFGNRSLAPMLCWFLLGEELEDFVWRYLKMVHWQENRQYPDPTAKKTGVRGVFDFAHLILGGLSDALFEWSDPKSPTPSILCLRRAMESLPHRGRYRGVSFIGIKVSIEQMIWRDECPAYDEDLFSVLVDCVQLTEHGPNVEQAYHRLTLHHPRRPNADQFLQALRSESIYQGVWNARDVSLRNFWTCLMRASYILLHQGRADDAAFLYSIVRTKFDALDESIRRKKWASLGEDPKLDSVRQQGKRVSFDDAEGMS